MISWRRLSGGVKRAQGRHALRRLVLVPSSGGRGRGPARSGGRVRGYRSRRRGAGGVAARWDLQPLTPPSPAGRGLPRSAPPFLSASALCSTRRRPLNLCGRPASRRSRVSRRAQGGSRPKSAACLDAPEHGGPPGWSHSARRGVPPCSDASRRPAPREVLTHLPRPVLRATADAGASGRGASLHSSTACGASNTGLMRAPCVALRWRSPRTGIRSGPSQAKAAMGGRPATPSLTAPSARPPPSSWRRRRASWCCP